MRLIAPMMPSSCLRSRTSSATSMRARVLSSPPLSKLRIFAPAPLMMFAIAPSGFVEEIVDVGAILAVDGDAAAARDVADDVVAKNGVTTLGAVDHQIVLTAYDDGRVVHAENALHRRGKLRLLLLLRRHRPERLPADFRDHLARRPFAIAEIGVEIFDAPGAVFGSNAQPVFVGDFFQAHASLPRLLFEQLAADFRGL